MSTRSAARLAWSTWALALALLAFGALLQLLAIPSTFWNDVVGGVLGVLPTATVGVLLSPRRAGHPIGWIFCLFALLVALLRFAGPYAAYTLVTAPGALPGGVALAWVASWVLTPAAYLLGYVILLFPTGRPPSSRWRLVAWLYAGWIVLVTLATALRPGPLPSVPTVTNPLGLTGVTGAAGALAFARSVADPVSFLFGCALIAALILRFRRATGAERQQLKWFAYACALGLVWAGVSTVLASLHAPVMEAAGGVLWGLTFAGVPILMGIAMLKYRLYDIDLLINRTLVYGLLTALLGTVYVGLVIGLQALVSPLTGQTGESPLVIVVSTLAIAALVRPVRRRIQSLIDRRFYRRKYDAQKTLAAFSAALRHEVNLEQIQAQLLAVVQETMQPAQVSLWLRPPPDRDREVRP